MPAWLCHPSYTLTLPQHAEALPGGKKVPHPTEKEGGIYGGGMVAPDPHSGFEQSSLLSSP